MVFYGLGGKNALRASQTVRKMHVMVNKVVFRLVEMQKAQLNQSGFSSPLQEKLFTKASMGNEVIL